VGRKKKKNREERRNGETERGVLNARTPRK
jgi:hypothetical protein